MFLSCNSKVNNKKIEQLTFENDSLRKIINNETFVPVVFFDKGSNQFILCLTYSRLNLINNINYDFFNNQKQLDSAFNQIEMFSYKVDFRSKNFKGLIAIDKPKEKFEVFGGIIHFNSNKRMPFEYNLNIDHSSF